MALTDESNGGIGATMLVGPTGYGGGYGNMGGFGAGGDWWGILLLIALLNGGFGGFGGWGGMGMGGMMGLGIDFPWLLNGQQNIMSNTNNGFRDQMINDNVTSIRDGVASLSTQLCGCCGDMQMAMANGFSGVQQALCNGFAGTTAAVTGAQNAVTQQLYNNEIASLNRSFAEQQANTQGFTGVNSGIADLRYTEATEACATRTAAATNTRDIIDVINTRVQGIQDKLCALELDGVKGQLAQAQRDNVNLQNALNMATMQASQVQQNATIIDGVYNRLSQCPVDTTPVYGRQSIFQCPVNVNGNNGCSCGCNGFAN